MPPTKRPPHQPSQSSNQRPQPTERRRSDEYSSPHPPLLTLHSYISNPPFLSLIPFGLQPHIMHVVRTSERQPPAPEEPLISVFVNSRLDKKHTILESSHHRQADRTEIRCCGSTTVAELKRKAAAQVGLKAEGMMMTRYNGEPGLNDGLTLEDYEIADTALLDMEVSTGDGLELAVSDEESFHPHERSLLPAVSGGMRPPSQHQEARFS